MPLIAQKLENINLKRLTVNEGLSQGSIFDIHQDKQGFLWFATLDGLNKYDGYEFTVYQHDLKDSNSISHGEVIEIIEDSRDYLWLLFEGSGLTRFDPSTETFQRFYHDPEDKHSLSHARVLTFFEDSRGYLWMGTRNGFHIFDPYTEQFHRFYEQAEKNDWTKNIWARNIREDKNGNIYVYLIQRQKKGLYKHQVLKLSFSESLAKVLKSNKVIPDLATRLQQETSYELVISLNSDNLSDNLNLLFSPR